MRPQVRGHRPGGFAGCSLPSDQPAQTTSDSPQSTESSTATKLTTSTESPPVTETEENQNTIFVGPDGAADNDGTQESPLGSIQHAIDRAGPGDTVHVFPGEYYESVRTKRPGEAGNPITITGPPDAIVHGDKTREWTGGIEVGHSHIHIRGLTIEGIQEPSNPDDPTSYMRTAIRTLPVNHTYLEDFVFKPHAIGNTRWAMISLNYVENVEVGEFQLIGPAGLEYNLEDEFGHNGEVVYVGNPLGFEFNGWDLVGKRGSNECSRPATWAVQREK